MDLGGILGCLEEVGWMMRLDYLERVVGLVGGL